MDVSSGSITEFIFNQPCGNQVLAITRSKCSPLKGGNNLQGASRLRSTRKWSNTIVHPRWQQRSHLFLPTSKKLIYVWFRRKAWCGWWTAPWFALCDRLVYTRFLRKLAMCLDTPGTRPTSQMASGRGKSIGTLARSLCTTTICKSRRHCRRGNGGCLHSFQFEETSRSHFTLWWSTIALPTSEFGRTQAWRSHSTSSGAVAASEAWRLILRGDSLVTSSARMVIRADCSPACMCHPGREAGTKTRLISSFSVTTSASCRRISTWMEPEGMSIGWNSISIAPTSSTLTPSTTTSGRSSGSSIPSWWGRCSGTSRSPRRNLTLSRMCFCMLQCGMLPVWTMACGRANGMAQGYPLLPNSKMSQFNSLKP